METFYLVMLIIFIICMIIAGALYFYFNLDEKKIKEVTTERLQSMGKEYTKEEFEETMFQQFVKIELAKVNDDYNMLKDIVSDDEYNNILLEVKKDKEQNIKKIITDIKKGYAKLIGFNIINNQEVANIWVQYSSVEYVQGYKEEIDEAKGKQIVPVIVSGNNKIPVYHEYILTFVKERSTLETAVCPSCGAKINIMLNSKCQFCDNMIVPKEKHWVYVKKEIANINK